MPRPSPRPYTIAAPNGDVQCESGAKTAFSGVSHRAGGTVQCPPTERKAAAFSHPKSISVPGEGGGVPVRNKVAVFGVHDAKYGRFCRFAPAHGRGSDPKN